MKAIAGAVQKRQHLTVEKDPNKLVKFCCGANIYNDGAPDPELKPDSEYPEWLFKLHTDWEPIPLESMSKDDHVYWRRVKKLVKTHERTELKTKNKNKDFGPRMRFCP